MKAKIICSDITKKYDNLVVFKSFSYKFNDVGFYLLFGPSGSGKTTLINILCGLTNFQSGKIQFANNVYQEKVDCDVVSNEIAYITQDSYFIDYLTVEDNLKLCNSEVERINELLSKFNLKDKKNLYPEKLSGGERQRLSIIQALLQNKKILILDEPTSSLDYENKFIIFNMLKNFKKDILIICSSHDEDIIKFCDKIIDFNKLDSYEHSLVINNSKKEFNNTNNNYDKGNVKNLYKYISMQGKYKYREKKSGIILSVVFILSLLICFACFNYEEKLLQSLTNKYKVNYLTAYCPITEKDYCESIFRSKNVVSKSYVYKLNTPQPTYNFSQIPGQSASGGDISFELDLETFPFDRNLNAVADAMMYGSYFNSSNQVILGYERAKRISSDLNSLIHTTVKLNLPDGVQSFEVIGILKKFNNQETKYLESNLGNDNFNDKIYLNSKYLEKYINDDVKGYSEVEKKSIVFYVYFSNFNDLYSFYKGNVGEKYGDKIVVDNFIRHFIDYMHSIQTLQMISYPIVIACIILSILFYFQIKRIEISYTKHIFCVYQYYGYSLKKIKFASMLYYLIDILKKILIAFFIAVILSIIFNYISLIFNIVEFKLLLVDFRISLIMMILLALLSLIISLGLFHRIKLQGWYNMLKERRDLL